MGLRRPGRLPPCNRASKMAFPADERKMLSNLSDSKGIFIGSLFLYAGGISVARLSCSSRPIGECLHRLLRILNTHCCLHHVEFPKRILPHPHFAGYLTNEPNFFIDTLNSTHRHFEDRMPTAINVDGVMESQEVRRRPI